MSIREGAARAGTDHFGAVDFGAIGFGAVGTLEQVGGCLAMDAFAGDVGLGHEPGGGNYFEGVLTRINLVEKFQGLLNPERAFRRVISRCREIFQTYASGMPANGPSERNDQYRALKAAGLKLFSRPPMAEENGH
jgi:hypothetical protein